MQHHPLLLQKEKRESGAGGFFTRAILSQNNKN
jgi:hypothetical protein